MTCRLQRLTRAVCDLAVLGPVLLSLLLPLVASAGGAAQEPVALAAKLGAEGVAVTDRFGAQLPTAGLDLTSSLDEACLEGVAGASGREALCSGRLNAPVRVMIKDRSANGTSASVGRAARTMRSKSRDWPSWDGAAVCLCSGRAHDRPFFPRPFPAPRSAGRIPPSDGDARGKSVDLRHAGVWAGGLLEDQHVQGLVRHQLLQPRVLLLELLKLLGHLRVHAPELRPPREYVCWLTPSRRQTSGTVEPFPRSTSACRSRPTICSVLRRFFIREPFQAPTGARGFSHKTWIKIWGGGQVGRHSSRYPGIKSHEEPRSSLRTIQRLRPAPATALLIRRINKSCHHRSETERVR